MTAWGWLDRAAKASNAVGVKRTVEKWPMLRDKTSTTKFVARGFLQRIDLFGGKHLDASLLMMAIVAISAA